MAPSFESEKAEGVTVEGQRSPSSEHGRPAADEDNYHGLNLRVVLVYLVRLFDFPLADTC